MAKIFKKLFVGDTAETIDTKVFKKLTTEEPQDDSIVGTWVLNEQLYQTGLTSTTHTFYINYTLEGVSYRLFNLYNNFGIWYFVAEFGPYFYYENTNKTYSYGDILDKDHEPITSTVDKRTIVITGGNDINNEVFISWLKANATKQ